MEGECKSQGSNLDVDILLDDCWLLLGMMFFDLHRLGNGVLFFL